VDLILTLPYKSLFIFGPSKWYVVVRLERMTKGGRWSAVHAKAADNWSANELTLHVKRYNRLDTSFAYQWVTCLCDYGPGLSLTASLYSAFARKEHTRISMDSLAAYARRAIGDEQRKRRALTRPQGKRDGAAKRKRRKRAGNVR
jgi:hypothetical protein